MQTINFTFAEQDFTFDTDRKLFSPNQLDAGSKLLLETVVIPKENSEILDLGCGWGAIGIILARLYPRSQVTLIDNDSLAISFAKNNIQTNGLTNVKTFKGDVANTLPDRLFDIVVSNPPWTKNISVNPQLVRFAYDHLQIGGQFYCVINESFRTQDYLESIFGNSVEINKRPPYKILLAKRTEETVNDLVPGIQGILAKLNIVPNPLLSQYFICDSLVIKKLVDMANLGPDEKILEIGSGLGLVTRELANYSTGVTALEIDKRYLKLLHQLPKTVIIRNVDGLDFLRGEKTRWDKIVANLPFVSADTFLFRLTKIRFTEAVLVLPPKLASDLITGKRYSDNFRAQELFTINRAHFFPMPDTDSVVVRLRKKK